MRMHAKVETHWTQNNAELQFVVNCNSTYVYNKSGNSIPRERFTRRRRANSRIQYWNTNWQNADDGFSAQSKRFQYLICIELTIYTDIDHDIDHEY